MHFYFDAIVTIKENRIETVYEIIEKDEDFWESENITSRDKMSPRLSKYWELKEKLSEIRQYADFLFLYTVGYDENNKLIYKIDSSDQYMEKDGKLVDDPNFRYPGDLVDPEIFDEVTLAITENVKVYPHKIKSTPWGKVFVAYFPLHDSQGNIRDVLGVELDANREAAAFSQIAKTSLICVVIWIIIAFILAMLIFRRISNPLYKDLSNTDLLTKIRNRNAFETDRYNLIKTHSMKGKAIIIIDLNDLKKFNDNYGHEVGDSYIEFAAQTLKRVESETAVAYRFGGDEFAIIMEQVPNPEEFMQHIRDIFTEVSASLPEEGSLAIGYAEFEPNFDKDIIETQKRADAKMYENKKAIKQARWYK